MADNNNPILFYTKDMADFATKVYDRLKEHGFELGTLICEEFANLEYKCTSETNLRKKSVYFIHSTHYPNPNAAYMQLFIANNMFKYASAGCIVDVLPYMAYVRQDRKGKSRVPITARLVADLIECSGSNKVIAWDMHCGQNQGFFSIPTDNIFASRYHANYFKANYDISDFVVVSPDHGGTGRARGFAKSLSPDMGLAIVDKRRTISNQAEVMNVIGKELIIEKKVILYDDMIDTGGSIVEAAHALRSFGAKEVYACATHGIFSAKNNILAEDKLKNAGIKVIIADSIPRPKEYLEKNSDWLTVVSLVEPTADAILNDHLGGSISQLFDAP